MKINPLLLTDVYKMGHMEQYPEGTTEIYSYLHTRTGEKYPEFVWFGLQYYLMEYLSQPITHAMVMEFLERRKRILGRNSEDIELKMFALTTLGYWPLIIKALPEGTIVPGKGVCATVRNTHPGFEWCVGFVESMLLHMWYPCTVSALSRAFYKVAHHYGTMTCDNLSHLPFCVHDFGYRSVTCEEQAAIGGAAHLLHFSGSDTVCADWFIEHYYDTHNTALSVPATEHSVMCAYGKDNEFEAFEHILDLYPKGIVSIVSDTYDIWNVLDNFMPRLKGRILGRRGKVVIRPDSGDPCAVILKAIDKLGEVFGYITNTKGFKELPPQVGLIYGDGIYLERYEYILQELTARGWASCNLVVGVGGLLLQSHSRDDLGFAFKATHAVINGEGRSIFKQPIDAPEKKSYTGYLRVNEDFSVDQDVSFQEQNEGLLETVFCDGKVFPTDNFDTIKERIQK